MNMNSNSPSAKAGAAAKRAVEPYLVARARLARKARRVECFIFASRACRAQFTNEKDGFFEQPAFQQFSRNVSTPC